MKRLRKKYLRLLHDRDKGTVAITFLLSLPIFLLIISFITQFALLINAQVALDDAAAVAARSAITALPTDPAVDTVGPETDADGNVSDPISLDGAAFVKSSACIQLSAISPTINGSPTDDAETITDAFRQAMPDAAAAFNENFAKRYTYADAATTIHWQPIDDQDNPIGTIDPPPSVLCQYRGQRVQFTITYSFALNAPGAMHLLGHLDPALDQLRGITGSVPGHYLTLGAKYNVQLSPGREAITDGNGWPSSLSGTSSP
jgi:TadE-like protein